MTIHFAEDIKSNAWDNLVLANPDKGNVFQSYELAEQKRLTGWVPYYLRANDIAITVLEKSVPFIGRLWYLPKGPGVTNIRELDDMLPSLKEFARKQRVFLIKIEPELRQQTETVADLLKLGLLKAAPIQPNASTVTVNLQPKLDEIMKNLNQKGRHAIKRAERDGVTVQLVESTDENCKKMYDLLATTAAGSFRIRSYNYYKSFWQRFSDTQHGQLFFAYDGSSRLVAGAYAITFGTKSTYKDGASVRDRTVYGASHLLQWKVIEWAKSRGSLLHDLCGAPPSSEINNPEHHHYGIGRFKTSFNKEVTDYIGVYDVVINSFGYSIWKKLGERIVVRLHNFLHQENYY
jgi:serine/alanine adding enzyme